VRAEAAAGCARLAVLDRVIPGPSFKKGLAPMAVELHITKRGETTCVTLLGEFEPAGVGELRARLGRFDDDEARPVLDLREIVVVGATSPEQGATVVNPPAPGSFDLGA
jgi:hypothetical protein